MFAESLSFAASAGAGVVVANAGAFLLAFTPAGWVGLIIGGLVVTGAAAVSITTDKLVKENSS